MSDTLILNRISGMIKSKSIWLYAVLKRYDFLVPAILTFPLMAILAWGNPITIGNDTMVHLYKVQLLSEQMKQLPLPLWGSWDWNWYGGYPFLKFYGPLSYIIMALPSLVLNPSAVMTWFILLYFPLSSISMYYLVKHLTKNKLASIISSVTYSYIPSHIQRPAQYGEIAFLLAFVFMPIALLFAEKYMKSRSRRHFILSIVATACTIYIDLTGGAMFLVFIFAWIMFRKKILQAFTTLISTTLLSVALIIPDFTYPHSFQALVSGPLPSVPNVLNLLFSPWIIVIALSIVFSYGISLQIFEKRKRHEKLSENDEIALICLTFLGVIGLYIIFVVFFNVFSLISVASLQPLIELLLPLLFGLTVLRLRGRTRFITAIVVIGLLLSISLTIPTYSPLQPQLYEGAFAYVGNDPTWFRVAVVPQEPISSVSPMYTNKPIINGFGAQFGSPDLIELLDLVGGRAFRTDGVKTYDVEMITNPDKAVLALQYLGIKYVIINSRDPIPGYNYSMALYTAMKSSNMVEEVYGDDAVKVLEIKNFTPVFASTQLRFVNSTEEAYETIINGTEIPILQTDSGTASQAKLGKNVDLTINYVEQTAAAFRIGLHVNSSSYVVIPISQSPSLLVSVNGREVAPLTAVPNFFCLYLPTEGSYNILISLKIPLIDLVAYSISFITFLSLLFWGIGINLLRRVKERRKG
jgi:hypothetical protein